YRQWDPATKTWKMIIPPTPKEYAPPEAYRLWELAGKPGTFEEWLKKATIEPGKTPEDIEIYARGILAGTISATNVPMEIRSKVIKRVNELRKTERIWTDEDIRSLIRTGIAEYKSKETIKDSIKISRKMTDIDKERAYLILDELIPEEPVTVKKWWQFWKR
ncbi:MAG: hypothetical protein COT14_01080, partial [Candidatus Diapherotrites archaeon CG08_land_8_20_14_0_20_30_16]